jgi:LPS-assembly lipoprotein
MSARLAFRFGLVAIAAGVLAGCLQPVHAPRFGAPSPLQSTLSQVEVQQISGYLGYVVKSELDFLLTGGEPARNARYVLAIKIVQDSGSSIIDATTGRAQSVTMQAQANYELRDTRDGKIRASGNTFASAAFDRSQQRFATTRAQRDAEQRLGKALAERMRIILTTALSQETLPVAPPAPELKPFPDPLNERRADEPGDEF